MEHGGFFLVILLSFLVFAIPGKGRFYYTLGISLVATAITSVPAIRAFSVPDPQLICLPGMAGSPLFTIDMLSALFILVVNFTMITGLLFSRGYLEPYRTTKSPAQFSLHYFSCLWLQFSMLAVLMIREGVGFLIAWELMAVSSFVLVLFEAEKRATLKTAVNYLIQMHVGLMFLILAFLVADADTGVMGFDSLSTYFGRHPNTGLFLLFLAGFAMKAGFVPFHTWLPQAHPAAPSHVSGIMSGVMIKMGIYGIFRVLASVSSDFYTIGMILLGIGLLTALSGIIMSVIQSDLKRILAYSSIENIGIIGTATGLGMIGTGIGNPLLTLLGYGGALLHVINHSLFKSMLFFGAGSVYRAMHTRNIEQMGGLVHGLPRTAGFFLAGTVAICALPPLNGFISEVLIYYGLFKGLSAGTVYLSVAFLLSLVALAFVGGLTLFSFSRAYSIVFLGNPRSETAARAKEVPDDMLFPQLLTLLGMLAVAFFPMAFLGPIFRIIGNVFGTGPAPDASPVIHAVTWISLLGGLLVLLVLGLMLFRYLLSRNRTVRHEPTWGCGYTSGSSRQEYTGSSFAANIGELAQPYLQTRTEFKAIPPEEIFPKERSFSTLPVDIYREASSKITDWSMTALKKLARLQTGNIRHYILYAFLFILAIFILLYLGIL